MAKYKHTYKSITARDKDYKRIWRIGGSPRVKIISWSETEATGRMKTAYIQIEGDKIWVDAYTKIAFKGNGTSHDVIDAVRKQTGNPNEGVIRLTDILNETTVSMGQIRSNPYASSFKSPEQIAEDMDYVPAKWSSNEAKLHMDADVKKMSKFLGKASQECIKIMMDGVKGKRYDALDIIRGIETGPWNRTHNGERPFMKMLWRKVRKGFRRYMPKGKLRK